MSPTSSRRRFALALTVNAVGNGLFLTLSTVYFTLYLGLQPTQLGTMLSAAAVAGILAGPALGHVADLVGARRTYATLLLLSALASLLFVAVRSPLAIAACLAAFTASEAGGGAARGAVIAALVPRAERVAYRSTLRALANVGLAVGAGIAALILLGEDVRWFHLALGLNAATFVVTAVLTLRIPAEHLPAAVRPHAPAASTGPPSGPPTGTPSGVRRSWRPLSLRDGRYLQVVALHAVLCVHAGVVTIGIPLWLVHRTQAPTWCVAMILIVNTVGVALLMGPLGRRVDTWPATRVASRWAGACLAALCLLLGLTDGTSGALVVTLLALAAVCHLLGEVLQSAVGWFHSFELAPEEMHGQYQGVFNAGRDVVDALAGIVFALVVVAPGALGWWLLAATVLVAGALLPGAAERARRNRVEMRRLLVPGPR